MTDDEFLSYCYWHAQTDRHLFHVDHARRLLQLVGEPEDRFDLPPGDRAFVAMDFEFVAPRVQAARDWLTFARSNPRVAAICRPRLVG